MKRNLWISVVLVSVMVSSLMTTRAHAKNDSGADYLVTVGEYFLQKGNIPDAVHEFHKALMIDPVQQQALEYLAKYEVKNEPVTQVTIDGPAPKTDCGEQAESRCSEMKVMEKQVKLEPIHQQNPVKHVSELASTRSYDEVLAQNDPLREDVMRLNKATEDLVSLSEAVVKDRLAQNVKSAEDLSFPVKQKEVLKIETSPIIVSESKDKTPIKEEIVSSGKDVLVDKEIELAWSRHDHLNTIDRSIDLNDRIDQYLK